MPQLDKETIAYLTQLSRIECSEEEQEKLLKNLDDVISYIGQLQEVNTDNVPPCNCVLKQLSNVMRDDLVGEILPRDLFLENAPSHVGGMIRVPPVLKQN